MIDIHTHVLPFVDDGSKSYEETVELLREEESFGVTDVICTPHLRANFRTTRDELDELIKKVQKKINECGIKINLHLGRELYITKHYKSNLVGFSATMPNKKYVLVEYGVSFDCEIVETVYEFVNMGYIPIIAHPERYSHLTTDDVAEVKNLGGLIQVNAESVTLSSFSKVGRFIKKLLDMKLVDFISSDIHYGRKNKLKKAYEYVVKKHGKNYAEKIFNENAKILIEG